MSSNILNAEEIVKMRVAGQLASEVLDYITPYVVSGISTGELNRLCHAYMVDVQKTIPAPLNYNPDGKNPYPASICTSVNEVICHGIPSDTHILKDGDILNIDVTVIKDGFHGDTSRMFLLGDEQKISEKAKKICQITYEAMYQGIAQVKPGNYTGDIGHAIGQFVRPFYLSVVEDYCGHGIGQLFHDAPQIMHIASPKTGVLLVPGMTFTIEPMLNAGTKKTRLQNDGWTVKTRDGHLSAQWEHTILVTEQGYEILTLSEKYPKLPGFLAKP